MKLLKLKCEIMEILEIKMIDHETAYVEAILEDSVLVHHQTLYDPPEYGSATWYTYVNISDVLEDFTDIGSNVIVDDLEDSIIQYLENHNQDWKLCEYY